MNTVLENKKFKNARYMTCGINEKLAHWYQLEIWDIISDFVESGAEVDYFQIFEFEVAEIDGKKVQKIIHKQENPEYEKEHTTILQGNGFNGRVWVIDDVDHSTMLFPEEY